MWIHTLAVAMGESCVNARSAAVATSSLLHPEQQSPVSRAGVGRRESGYAARQPQGHR